MNKAFPIIIWVAAIIISLYTLPDLAAFFGFQISNSNQVSNVVMVSDNAGKVFNETYWNSRISPTVYDFEIDGRDSSLIYAATDAGLFISKDNGGHWYSYSDLEGQLIGAKIYQIKKDINNPGRIFVSLFKNGQGGIYETQDKFFTLQKIFDTKEAAAYKLISASDKIYFGLSDGRLISYSTKDSGFTLLAAVGSAITDITIKNSQIYVADKNREIWQGNINDQNFFVRQEISSSQSAYTASMLGATLDTAVAKNPIKFIVLDNQDQIYLASSDKLYRSSNQGQDWQLILDVPGRKVNSVIFGNNGKIIVGTSS